MNIYNKFIVMLLLGITLPGQSQERQLVDKIIARVGGEIILLSDVEEQYAYFKESQPFMEESAKCDILEGIVAQKLIINQAKIDSLEISTTEVDQQLDLRFNSILQQMNGDEEFFKQYYGATVAEMKEQFRSDQREQILSEKMQRKLITEVEITPKEVEEFYNEIPRDSLPFLNAEVEISEIVYKPPVNSEEHQKALDKLTDLRSRIIDQGEDFEELAKKYSADGSADKGGDLGFSNRGQMVAPYEAAAYSLKNGEISDIVETDFGLHLIKMIERRGNRIHTKHILIRPEVTAKDLEIGERYLDSIRNLVVVDSISFESALTRFSDKTAQSYHYNGRIRNPKTGGTYFETGDLPSDIFFAIEDMKVGDITPPIELTSPLGDKLFRIIKLDSRSKPHQVSLETDYSKIQQFAKESKKNIYLAEWISGKYETTYIKIDKSYVYCENLSKLGVVKSE